MDYTPTIELIYGKRVSVTEARRRVHAGQIVRRFGTWACTDFGLECLSNFYPIKADRLNERYNNDWGWVQQMAHHRWCDRMDFLAAFEFALEHHCGIKAAHYDDHD